MKEVMSSLDRKLNEVDGALFDKLEDEEDRYERMLDYYKNSITWLQ